MIRRSNGRMALCVAALVLNVIFIWGNSALPASVSGALSRWLRQLLGFISQGSAGVGEGSLRKLMHFAEFCLLGVMLSWLCGMLMARPLPVAGASIVSGIFTACVDETIQSFSPGRNPSLMDVGIDTAGAAVGIGLLFLGYIISNKFWRKTK